MLARSWPGFLVGLGLLFTWVGAASPGRPLAVINPASFPGNSDTTIHWRLALGTTIDHLQTAAEKQSLFVGQAYRAVATTVAKKPTPQTLAEVSEKTVTALAPVNEAVAPERLHAAQAILVAVLRWLAEQGEDDRETRSHEANLQERLRDLRRRYLDSLLNQAADERSREHFLQVGEQLVEIYPGDRSLRTWLAERWAWHAGLLEKNGNLNAAHAALLQGDRWEPDSPAAQVLRERWLKEASKLAAQARAASDTTEAIRLWQRALAHWPAFPDGQDELLRLEKKYTILNVGVPSLPRLVSPALAASDSERWALDLVFERLLVPGLDASRGQVYEPQLAADLPRLTGNTFHFWLDPRARWCTGERVRVEDVLHIVKLQGRDPIWRELVKPPTAGEQALQIDFQLHKPYFDPLFPFTFPVLPRLYRGRLLSLTDVEFAREPVGSGPYYLQKKPLVEGDRLCVIFRVNSHYQRPPVPVIREVRFQVARDPVAEFQAPTSPLHLLLSISAEREALLRAAKLGEVVLPRPFRQQRVHFLAVNQRVGGVLASVDFRQALAAAIDRERLVDEEFRGRHPAYKKIAALGAGLGIAAGPLRQNGQDAHRPLDSLFPSGSWPAAGSQPLRFHPDKVLKHLGDVKIKRLLPGPIQLRLFYPNDDWRVASACRQIALQFEKLCRESGVAVQLRSEGRSPNQLREDLERRNYDLAYCHLDHETAGYWLWSLFHPDPESRGPGGSNFLGYDQDAQLVSHFRSLLLHRDFHKVKEQMQLIRGRLEEGMPVIPLWQLDLCLAHHRSLLLEPFEPMRPLASVSRWQIRKGG